MNVIFSEASQLARLVVIHARDKFALRQLTIGRPGLFERNKKQGSGDSAQRKPEKTQSPFATASCRRKKRSTHLNGDENGLKRIRRFTHIGRHYTRNRRLFQHRNVTPRQAVINNRREAACVLEARLSTKLVSLAAGRGGNSMSEPIEALAAGGLQDDFIPQGREVERGWADQRAASTGQRHPQDGESDYRKGGFQIHGVFFVGKRCAHAWFVQFSAARIIWPRDRKNTLRCKARVRFARWLCQRWLALCRPRC